MCAIRAVVLAVLGASAWTGVLASPMSPMQQPQAFEPIEAKKCSIPSGWEMIRDRKPRYVVFGEMHGTKQAPAFVGGLACALASRGKRILVAVEHSSTENEAFQKAWKLPEATFTSALKQAGWAGREDGIASEAMLDLVIRLHGLHRRGYAVDIVTFNGARNDAQAARFAQLPGQGPHEAAQAENIRNAAAAKPYDHVLVLVGNIHARKRPVERAGVAFEPMAMQLGSPSTVVTLDMQTAGGTAWNCQLKPGVKLDPKKPIASDAIACGSYPLRGTANLKRKPFVALTRPTASNSHPDYDGIFWLGSVSASLPAVSQPR